MNSLGRHPGTRVRSISKSVVSCDPIHTELNKAVTLSAVPCTHQERERVNTFERIEATNRTSGHGSIFFSAIDALI